MEYCFEIGFVLFVGIVWRDNCIVVGVFLRGWVEMFFVWGGVKFGLFWEIIVYCVREVKFVCGENVLILLVL